MTDFNEYGPPIILALMAIGVIGYIFAIRRITETDVDKTDHWRWRRK